MPTLNWLGKESVVNHHHDVPFKTLEKQYTFGADSSENKIIHGDNLEALKALLPEYEGRIKCIYIDPPYNTGNEGWVYNDNVNSSRIQKWLGQVVGKEAEDLSRHDKWLCMMYPRLNLLHQLLADDGAIFISIDDNEQANLKLLCDEIFGSDNILANLIWDLGTGTTAGHFTRGHEYILSYAKKKSNISNFKNPEENEQIVHGALKKISKKNPAVEITFPIGFEYDGDSAAFSGEIGNSEKEYILSDEMRFKDGKLVNPTTIKAGFAMKNQVEDFIAGKDVYDSKGQKVIRFFFNRNGILFYEKEKSIVNPRTVIRDVANTKNGTTDLANIFGKSVFDFPKPQELLNFFIQLTTDKSSIILDSFAGSGTTAHAVLNLNKQDGGNRKFILVEMEDYAETITAERVKRVIDGYPFKGKKEEEIYNQPLTIKNLAKASDFLEEADAIAESKKDEYDKISKPKIEDNCIKVIGTKVYDEKMEGLGGDFSFYELGEPIMNGDYINENQPVEKIKEYIWYSETHSKYEGREGSYFLGNHNGAGYYFYYEKNSITTLSYDTLNIVEERAEQYIIYADQCLIDKEDLLAKNIIFKKIPRDIRKF